MRTHALVLLLLLLLTLSIAAGPVRAVDGYVDLHSHLMAEHSFGGGFFWGNLEGPINPAVVRCDGSFPLKTHATTLWPVVGELLNPKFCGSGVGDTGWHLGKRRGYDERRCRKIFWITIPGTCPKPHFEGWPTWTTIAHQQMWQEWLRQAHQGGLQIMVVSLADSDFLCINTPPLFRRYPCSEMSSVVRQLQRAREFVARNGSWVGIATTAAEARALIAQGKLALVFSVEITKLFPSGDFLAQLDDWRSLGIRSVQVVHHADNRFGGAAQIPALKKAADLIELILHVDVTGINNIVCRNGAGVGGSCDGINYLNERGLSAEGSALVQAMMDRGMLLDVSHLSRRSFRDVYNLALPRGYPLLYSHTHTWDTIADCDADAKRNEKFLLDEEIHMISDTGGMIGLRTGPEHTTQYTPAGYPSGSPVANRCQGSSRSFAQSLMYSVDRGLSVGFGADLNGFTRQMQPRYQGDCPVDRLQITFNGGPNWFQGQGFGHVGLFPELMADLAAVQVPQRYLDHLNQSAETFLRLWERSESLAVAQSVNLARQATATASSTYCSGAAPGPHCYSPARVNDGSRSTLLGGVDSWANGAYQPMPQWVELTWSSPVNASRVDLYTTSGYEVSDYDLEYRDGSGIWRPWLSVSGNTSVFRSHPNLPAVSTTGIRVLGRLGPSHQPGYIRVNEIEVY